MTGAGLVVPQRAVLVLPSTGEFDSRAWRIASSLAARGHSVTAVARAGLLLPDDETIAGEYRILRVPMPDQPTGWRRLIGIGLAIRAQSIATRRLAPPADLVHAMGYMGLPVGLELGRRDHAPVVYDARDIYVEARNIARLPRPLRWLFARSERRWAHRADRVVTVNDGCAEELTRLLGVDRPLVVMNCAPRHVRATERPRRFHEALGLDPDRRIVLYHGGLTRDRGIEQLITAIADVPDATLVLLGYGDAEAELRRIAADPARGGRIAVLPAVPPADLVAWVASADVVAIPIQPTTVNHRLTTPNKLFEAIAARVPVVASDLPLMAEIVCRTGCGVVVDPTDPVALGAGLREVLDAPPDRRKAFDAGLAAAAEEFAWEPQMDRLLAEYGRLTGRPW